MDRQDKRPPKTYSCTGDFLAYMHDLFSFARVSVKDFFGKRNSPETESVEVFKERDDVSGAPTSEISIFFGIVEKNGIVRNVDLEKISRRERRPRRPSKRNDFTNFSGPTHGGGSAA